MNVADAYVLPDMLFKFKLILRLWMLLPSWICPIWLFMFADIQVLILLQVILMLLVLMIITMMRKQHFAESKEIVKYVMTIIFL